MRLSQTTQQREGVLSVTRCNHDLPLDVECDHILTHSDTHSAAQTMDRHDNHTGELTRHCPRRQVRIPIFGVDTRTHVHLRGELDASKAEFQGTGTRPRGTLSANLVSGELVES